MVTTLNYAEISNAVYRYGVGEDRNWTHGDFVPVRFEEGMAWGATRTKFKGCVYVRKATRDVVVAFQGTDFKHKIGDWFADLQIVVGLLPQYCGAAMRLFEKASKLCGHNTVTLTGHSLGGALAQVVGHWSGLPFVTFNAPGMWGDIQKIKFLPLFKDLSPGEWAALSWNGTFIGSKLAKQMASTGRNFRHYLDPVSAYGMHYGPVTRLWVPGLNPHSMDNMVEKIRRTDRWRDQDPLDPRNKEWGEL